MYFNEKKTNTNIDNDFNNKQNGLSSILSFISKYKKIIIISIIILILLIIMVMIFSNRKVNKYLELTGEENVTIYEGSDYVEPGYIAYNSKDEDLKSEVIIETNLNNKEVGKYEILYTLGNITRIRIVNVIAKPKEYTYIHLNGVEKGTTDVYVKLGEKYEEPGYTVFSSTGTDLTNNVVVTGEVDTSKKGTYIKTYTVMDTSGVTISASRNVIVIDSNINLTLNTNSYTNKDIIINIEVIDEYFDYMILPDNTKVNVTKYTYKVTENGKYTFKTANKKGMTKESSIEVKNIDKIAPSGSCSGSYKNGVSTIKVTAKDNIGISKYVINNKNYTSNQITINSELKTANIVIYDKANNTKSISCNLENKNTVSNPVEPVEPVEPVVPVVPAEPKLPEKNSPGNAVAITNISKSGVLITISAQRIDANITGYYFSYTNKRPNKNTGGYLATSIENIQVARLPGTTYVWVEDAKGRISNYKTVTIDANTIINTDGTVLKGTTLNTILTRNGSSTTELNKLIARSARAAGLYTKEAAATAAVTLIAVLDQKYNVRLPYMGGGKHNYVGVSGKWGWLIPEDNVIYNKTYPYFGFDCDGYTHWSYYNAGININLSHPHNYWYWERTPFSKNGEIGDIISRPEPHPHVKIIVGKTSTGYIVAHASGTGNGVLINVHPYTDIQDYSLIKGSKIATYEHYTKNTNYPTGF